VATSTRRQRELARARYLRRQQLATIRAEQHRTRTTRVTAAVALVAVVGIVAAVTVTSGSLRSRSTSAAARGAGAQTSGAPAAGTASAANAPGLAAAAAVGLHCTALPSPATRTPRPLPSPRMSVTRSASYQATIDTTCGRIVVDLDAKAAPHAVNSFRYLATSGFYDDTVCHRLTTASEGLSVLQCGDPTGTGSGGPGYHFSVENAPRDGRYPAGTLAMARATSPDSNGSQFFLTYADSTIPSPDGYTVFGHVREGLDLLRRIGRAGVDPGNPPRPRVPVGITSVSVTEEDGS
jgi:peptidyl-prolyl cis-trans isomerase B (cyclophilin B)